MDVKDFQERFSEAHRIEDIFCRDFVVCLDNNTRRRALIKNYSAENQESTEAVLQSMCPFIAKT